MKYAAKHIHRAAGLLYLVTGLLFLLPFLGCPVFDGSYYGYQGESYHVYYEGNGNTEGSPPVDSKAYFAGNKAIVLAKPEGLKRGTLNFLG
jgi:hypothetical protein